MADVTRRLSTWIGGLLLSCVPPALADKPPSSVADLRYGVTLYHYYQQDYLSALSELLVVRERDGIQGHGDNPELMEAGISLSFGLQRHAEALYSELLDQGRSPAVRQSAWFYLGKLHYLRGNWDQAERYFSRSGERLDRPLAEERAALISSLQIRRNQLPPRLPDRSEQRAWGEWRPFVLYNFGAAHARAGDYPTALAYYQQLRSLSAQSDEQRAVRDKGLTGAGYIYLLQGDHAQAISHLSRVRRDTPLAHQALLGHGWAALAQGHPDRAIQPWQYLRRGSLIHPPVQESLLALPHAYEKLGAEVEALRAYEEGEKLLEVELALIDELRTSLTPEEILAAIDNPAAGRAVTETARLRTVNEAESDNWLLIDRTSALQTRSVYLTELFAQNDFQTRVQELRDLVRLQNLLRSWQPKLDNYALLLQEKQALREQRTRELQEQRVFAQQADLLTQRDTLHADLEAIIADRDYMALADNDSRELYERVTRAQATLDRLRANGQDTTEQQASVDLYRGILLWQAAQEYPDRIWRGQRLLRDLNTALETLDGNSQNVQAILATDYDIEPQLQRLAAAGAEVREQLATTDQALLASAAALLEQIDVELIENQRRLNHYLAQTRLAAARLYDTAMRRQQP